MSLLEVEREAHQENSSKEREAIKQVLLNEVELRLILGEFGARFDLEKLKKFKPDNSWGGFVRNRLSLGSFRLPNGINAQAAYNKWSPYSVVVEDDKPVLYNDDEAIGVIEFIQPEQVHDEILSTGERFRDIAHVSPQGGIHVMYSSECALKDRGEDCLFCGFNERAKDPEHNKVLLKTPKQVAEIYDIARRHGIGNHIRLTGGFVPERREIEYYLDVADAIQEKYDYFYGVAVIGAPADFSVIDKYREAGYENISTNLEVWDKNIFAAMCPGKEKRNGGWQNWVNALEYAVGVFGKGNVHTNFVGGLEPKQSILEGIEYLASKGIVPHFSAFRPVPGTPLEGYRSPEASWHWDLLLKATEIFKRNGFTTLQLYSGPASGPHAAEVFRIITGDFEGDTLNTWKFPALV